jgi:hypothetical protein
VRQVDDPALAMCKGEIDVAFFRSIPGPPEFDHVLLGCDKRLAAVATDDALNQGLALSLGDLSSRRVALCATAGTTGRPSV